MARRKYLSFPLMSMIVTAVHPLRLIVVIGLLQTTPVPAVAAEELVPQLSHGNAVAGVAFAPDGRSVLTGSYDHSVRLWDTSSGRELRRFQGHINPVHSYAFDTDGGRVLAGSHKIARLWDVASDRETRPFKGHDDWVSSAAFSPDGRSILTGSKNVADLWDVASGRQIQHFEGHDGQVTSVAFAPDGRSILTGSRDGSARLWDVSSGGELHRFVGHTGKVYGVAFAPDGRRILTGSSDDTARLWDVASGRELQKFKGHNDSVWSVAFSPDGRRVLTGSEDATARLWDTASGRQVGRFDGHGRSIWSVAFSPDGHRVLTGSSDKTARLWDAVTGQEQLCLVGFEDGEWAALAPDGTFDGSSKVEKHLALVAGKTTRELTADDIRARRRPMDAVVPAGSDSPALVPVPAATQTTLFPPSAPTAVPSFTGPRHALVIGAGAYRNVAPLPSPARDARALGTALRSLGFTVTELLDPDQDSLQRAVARFAAGLPKNALAFVVYSGHGVEVANTNLLLPIDFPAPGGFTGLTPRDVAAAMERRALPLDALLDRLSEAEPRALLVLLDACRNNPLQPDGRLTKEFGGEGGLGPATVRARSYVVYAAGARQKAVDRLSDKDSDPNSLFIRHFLRQLTTPGRSFDAAVKATAMAVEQEARQRAGHLQRPAIYQDLYEDIVLSPP